MRRRSRRYLDRAGQDFGSTAERCGAIPRPSTRRRRRRDGDGHLIRDGGGSGGRLFSIQFLLRTLLFDYIRRSGSEILRSILSLKIWASMSALMVTLNVPPGFTV
ncbi:hypothetical protein BHE74_00007553 [Ensete ventricosum]|uniref:Uncharacterized protein n=1 Tax=Ensete ventricosum TaxID=4639 RepID=A0A444GAG8_ENSVE|nr:hypothetical protein GW17_00003497 [Ensete ventricosum]RWW83925.1 hypothetical protein BHE74_00007553 [Ensete ventricosum]RZR71076.1 hypothetical protein BHM03_00003292 [Ensete ventricosum]